MNSNENGNSNEMKAGMQTVMPDYREWVQKSGRYAPSPEMKTGGTAPPLACEADASNPGFNQNCNDASCSCHEVDFPYDKLQSLDEKISSTRWIVPVLPDQELECLIEAAIHLCQTGTFY